MRKRLGLTQQELAEELGVWKQLVSYWETGQREPNLEHQALLAEFEREMRRKERKPTTQPPQTRNDIPVERKLDQLLDVISLYPNPTLHAQAANFYLTEGRPDDALYHINETLKIRPDSPPFMMIQARCFLMKGEFLTLFIAEVPFTIVSLFPREKGVQLEKSSSLDLDVQASGLSETGGDECENHKS